MTNGLHAEILKKRQPCASSTGINFVLLYLPCCCPVSLISFLRCVKSAENFWLENKIFRFRTTRLENFFSLSKFYYNTSQLFVVFREKNLYFH